MTFMCMKHLTRRFSTHGVAPATSLLQASICSQAGKHVLVHPDWQGKDGLQAAQSMIPLQANKHIPSDMSIIT